MSSTARHAPTILWSYPPRRADCQPCDSDDDSCDDDSDDDDGDDDDSESNEPPAKRVTRHNQGLAETPDARSL